MLPIDPTRQIARLRFRLGCILVLRQWLRLFFIWIMVWATGTVAVRAVFRVDRWTLMWGLAGLLLAGVVGMVLALRKIPSAAALRAVLDRHGNRGGLLMAAGDTDIGAWTPRISDVSLPVVHWRFGRPCLFLIGAIAFLVTAVLAPDRSFPLGQRQGLRIGGEIEKLTNKLEVLEQEEILPPEKAEALNQDLEQVEKDALGTDPAKTLETIDHLERSFNKAAADSADSVVSETERASQLQELSAALQAVESEMDPTRFGEAMKELAQMATNAASEDEMLARELSDELREACESGSLTAEQLEALRESLEECKAGQRAKLERLVDARLVDADKLALCDKRGERDPEALRAGLCEGQSCAAALAGSLPGRGGINRGRGDAAMTWQDEVAQEDAAFKEKVLPPSAVASLKESRLAAISAGTPTEAGPSGGSTGGVLQSAQGGGGEAHTQRILPKHAQTVQRYFDRGNQ
ncbi:MAG: hypothetical protein R6U98_33265 [Pirellulaceae bacterium]